MNNLNLTLNITQACNLKCRYCYVQRGNKSMPWKVAKQAVDFFVDKDKYSNTIVSFTTAEPLLEWELIRKVIKYSEGKGVQRFDLATNGMLITKKVLDYCMKHNVILQLSFDGRQRIHDNIRFHKRKATSRVLNGKLKLIKKYYFLHLELRITVTPDNVEYLYDSVEYLVSNKFNKDMRINIVPVVSEHWSNYELSIFEKNIFKIAALFIEYHKAGEILNICSSECFPKQNHLLNIAKYKDSPEMFCNVGYGIISVDCEGRIWPCYWLGSSSYKHKNILALGDISKREFYPEKIKLVGSHRRNKYLSCRVWNFLLNEDSNKPLDLNKKIFKIWLSASQFVNNQITTKLN